MPHWPHFCLIHLTLSTDTKPRLDYCNSVFHQISAANLHALQSVLNAAARLVMRKRKYDHITATLRDDLHWLPIRQREMYKLCTIVYKCLHAAAPPYLSELCIPVSTSAGCHFLRSATYGDLLVPRTSTSTYGPRSFAVSGPSVWNKLPATLRISPTLGQFQSKLKAVLFRSAYETWLGAFVTA